ncbi:hypothetical protein CC2G_004027 [Coprinopsis cinerea AmutBmut pab1-1]|nr:hypothetical protein CC2G_004027 [Coprinopsis cinerea AmutBmut pab1-1]
MSYIVAAPLWSALVLSLTVGLQFAVLTRRDVQSHATVTTDQRALGLYLVSEEDPTYDCPNPLADFVLSGNDDDEGEERYYGDDYNNEESGYGDDNGDDNEGEERALNLRWTTFKPWYPVVQGRVALYDAELKFKEAEGENLEKRLQVARFQEKCSQEQQEIQRLKQLLDERDRTIVDI